MRRPSDLILNNRGVALILVLWVLIILSAITGQFSHSMRGEIKSGVYAKEQAQAYYNAHAGIYRALHGVIHAKEPPLNTGDESESTDSENETVDFRVNTDIPVQDFGQGKFKVRIGNESGKINVNYARSDLLKLMAQAFTEDDKDADIIVDSIMDWRDKDSNYRLNGAENNYYQSLPEPYKCRNGYFRTLDEVLLVRGVTREMFYGGLKEVVSVAVVGKLSAKAQKNYNRKEMVNINAASEQVLGLFPVLDDQAIEGIRQYRSTKDISSFSELVGIIGADPAVELKKYIDYKNGRFYTLDSTGWMIDNGAKWRIRALFAEKSTPSKGYRIIQWNDFVSDVPVQ